MSDRPALLRTFRLTTTLGLVLLPLASCAPAATDDGAAEASSEVPEILIRGQDYAFDVQTSIPAGPVRFGFENVGEVPHEVVIVQLNEGVTPEQVAGALQGETDPRALMAGVGGILIADPGQTSLGMLQLDMESGRTYALLCNFTDDEDAPPHIALGMMRIFQVS